MDWVGLYYFGVRYYMPWLGRWTAVGLVDGLNLYYCISSKNGKV